MTCVTFKLQTSQQLELAPPEMVQNPSRRPEKLGSWSPSHRRTPFSFAPSFASSLSAGVLSRFFCIFRFWSPLAGGQSQLPWHSVPRPRVSLRRPGRSSGPQGPDHGCVTAATVLAWDSTTVQADSPDIVLVSILVSSYVRDVLLLRGVHYRPSDLQPHPG